MNADKFDWTDADVQSGGVRIFTSVEAAQADALQKTLATAQEGGYDTRQRLPDSVLCGKHSSPETIEVLPNGSWRYRHAMLEQIVSGPNANWLRWFLTASPEDRKLFVTE